MNVMIEKVLTDNVHERNLVERKAKEIVYDRNAWSVFVTGMNSY